MSDDRKTKAELDLQLSELEQEAFFAFGEKHTLAEAARWLHDHKLITLSEQAISKWLAKRRKEAGDVKFRSYLAGIKEDNERAMLLGAEVGSAAHLNDANVLMLSQALFEARRTNDPFAMKGAAKLFSMVLESVAKAKAAEASVIAAETSRDKFQFDAAEKIDARLEELVRIKQNTTDDGERMQRIIATVFGQRPGQLTSANLGGGRDVSTGSLVEQTSNIELNSDPNEGVSN